MAKTVKYTSDAGVITELTAGRYIGAQAAGAAVDRIPAKRARHAVLAYVADDQTAQYTPRKGTFRVSYLIRADFDALTIGSTFAAASLGNPIPAAPAGYTLKVVQKYSERLMNTVIRGL